MIGTLMWLGTKPPYAYGEMLKLMLLGTLGSSEPPLSAICPTDTTPCTPANCALAVAGSSPAMRSFKPLISKAFQAAVPEAAQEIVALDELALAIDGDEHTLADKN